MSSPPRETKESRMFPSPSQRRPPSHHKSAKQFTATSTATSTSTNKSSKNNNKNNNKNNMLASLFLAYTACGILLGYFGLFKETSGYQQQQQEEEPSTLMVATIGFVTHFAILGLIAFFFFVRKLFWNNKTLSRTQQLLCLVPIVLGMWMGYMLFCTTSDSLIASAKLSTILIHIHWFSILSLMGAMSILTGNWTVIVADGDGDYDDDDDDSDEDNDSDDDYYYPTTLGHISSTTSSSSSLWSNTSDEEMGKTS